MQTDLSGLNVVQWTTADSSCSSSGMALLHCQDLTNTSTSSSLSSVGELDSIPEWKDGKDEARLDFIRKDCEARLKDVRLTNKKAKSLSAFVSILSFISFLAKLTFSKDSSLNLYKQDGCGLDQIQFQCFCDRYLLRDKSYISRINKPGLSYLLYKFVRCGLIHGATLLNTKSKTNQLNVKVYLSHEEKQNSSLGDVDKHIQITDSHPGGKLELTLNAFVLCKELESAIQAMFADASSSVRESILKTFEEETPILCYHGK